MRYPSAMDLDAQAEILPTTAGVYLFRAASGEVLYVGKAINLRARVRQYLQGHDARVMVRYLVAASDRIDTLPVSNEKEALILENSLIKQHQPRYNIRLRDDKNFLHLRIDPKAFWPRYTLVRKPKDDGARYFGPYHSATHARRTLSFVQKSFPLRTCADVVLRARKRPCLLHQMRRCVAPCVALCTPAEYGAVIDESVMFLQGRNRDLLRRLERRMADAAEGEQFEEAARVRDLLRSVEAALQSQSVADVKLGDRDVWALFREGDRGAIACLPVRGGLAREPRVFPFQGEVGEDEALLSAALNRWYEEGPDVPPEVVLPVVLPDGAALAELLTERRGAKVELHVPKRGDKTRLLTIARAAAETRFAGAQTEEQRRERALETIAEIVGLDALPYRMECFDNSNLLGEDAVASQVVFIEGKPARAEYRRYKVKTVFGADDYATMREILGRRLRRAAEEGTFPDLLVVDGGRGQLSAAEDVLRELGLEDQPVIGIAKPRTERRRGDTDAVDKIILRGQADPVILREDDPALRMLQFIRDEAHRTAIGFHRKTRSKSALVSELDAISGIGKTRRQALLKHFGSTRALKAATVAEIAAVPGFGGALAEKIRLALGGG